MRLILVCLLCIVLGLQYKLWLEHDSIINWFYLDKKLQAQLIENNHLRARNQALQADIAELKANQQAVEEHARFDLGLVKQDEMYYQFVD